jgi:hypothetical protein
MIVRYAKHRKCSNLSSIRLCELVLVSVVAKNDIAKIDSANKTLELRIIGWNISPLINYYKQ